MFEGLDDTIWLPLLAQDENPMLTLVLVIVYGQLDKIRNNVFKA